MSSGKKVGANAGRLGPTGGVRTEVLWQKRRKKNASVGLKAEKRS